MVVWLIGLSGSGKTTLGSRLYEYYKEKRDNVVFLDGDILREVWGEDLGHSIDAREKNAHRISHLCKVLDKQGMDVVAAVLSIFPDWQRWNRDNFSEYYEVFLDVPMDILESRDTKGLYSQAKRGEIKNVVGVDIPFPRPMGADIILNDWNSSPPIDASLRKIIEKIPD